MATETTWIASERYPDPAVRVLDKSFAPYRLVLASVERLATGTRWAEGPVWFGDGRYLLWSDIPNNRIMRWDEETGTASVFRKPSNNANGNTRDRQGRLVTCEHHSRRVTRTEYDGAITVICDQFRRQEAELAERRRGQVRRLDLVQRSAIRASQLLRRRGRAVGIADERLSRRRPKRRGDDRRRRHRGPQRALLLARREQTLHRRVAQRAAANSDATT